MASNLTESQRAKAWTDAHKKPCPLCGKLIFPYSKYCKGCAGELRRATGAPDITLENAIYHTGHRSSAFALVRARARDSFRKIGITRCQMCGYDKHIEACHIKAISSFSLDTMLSVINDLSNLIGLCPNCHWEFDHDLISIEEIVRHTGVEPAGQSLEDSCVTVSLMPQI